MTMINNELGRLKGGWRVEQEEGGTMNEERRSFDSFDLLIFEFLKSSLGRYTIHHHLSAQDDDSTSLRNCCCHQKKWEQLVFSGETVVVCSCTDSASVGGPLASMVFALRFGASSPYHHLKTTMQKSKEINGRPLWLTMDNLTVHDKIGDTSHGVGVGSSPGFPHESDWLLPTITKTLFIRRTSN